MNMIIENLSKSYLQGREKIAALKNVSFSVPQGSTMSIIGHSGSGKTTLLSLLAGLEPADSGTIRIGESTITDMTEKELTHFRAKNMGIVFQQYHLMPHLSALENVLLPLEINGIADSKTRAEEALHKVGLENRTKHLPSELSGGENQRVAIARAMVHTPSIVLADEPSGSLDLKNGELIMRLLFELSQETKSTLVLVTHDVEMAKRCQHSIHLRGGSIE
jgi:putative ABC transport system ATP-binding protein